MSQSIPIQHLGLPGWQNPSGRKARCFCKGQSLMEFVLVMPVMILILLGGFYLGLGAYNAHMASDAIQFILMNENKMAATPGPVGAGTLLGYINSGNLQGSIKAGDPVDSVEIAQPQAYDFYTALVVAKKRSDPGLTFLFPALDIRSAQVINQNLIEATAQSGSAPTHPADTPWFPGGTANKPPWES